MSAKRKGDKVQSTRFRTDRFVHDGEKWYYETREGTTEGPFRTRPEAEEHLRNYVRLVNSGWWNEEAGELELEPFKVEPGPAEDHEAQVWATRRGH